MGVATVIPPSYLFKSIYDRTWTDPAPEPAPAEEGDDGGPPRRAASLAQRLLRGLAQPAPARRAGAL